MRRSTQPVPPEILRWSWPAFVAPWLWTFDNHISTYPSSRGGLPKFGKITWYNGKPFWYFRRYGLIYLGKNGNRLAWRARKWESVEEFKAFQRRLLWKYLAYYILLPLFIVGVFIVLVLVSRT